MLLDLHGGDLVEALEPFAISDASPHEERTRGIPRLPRSRFGKFVWFRAAQHGWCPAVSADGPLFELGAEISACAHE